MPDLPVPDPATRDLLKAAFDAGMCFQVAFRNDLRPAPDFPAWLAERFPPLLPDEPPDGTVLRGHGTYLWQRADDRGTDGGNWYSTGDRGSHTWAEAYAKGADPGRRLHELPDPEDSRAIAELAQPLWEQVDDYGDWATARHAAQIVVRALTERGQQ